MRGRLLEGFELAVWLLLVAAWTLFSAKVGFLDMIREWRYNKNQVPAIKRKPVPLAAAMYGATYLSRAAKEMGIYGERAELLARKHMLRLWFGGFMISWMLIYATWGILVDAFG